MVLLKILAGLIIYILICVIIGFIKFKEKPKKYIMSVLSILFNGFMGFMDTIFFILFYMFFSNHPKGSGYYVPESEEGLNAMIGLFLFVVYLLLLLPINIYMKRKGKVSTKVYLLVNILATIIGLGIYWTWVGTQFNKIF